MPGHRSSLPSPFQKSDPVGISHFVLYWEIVFFSEMKNDSTVSRKVPLCLRLPFSQVLYQRILCNLLRTSSHPLVATLLWCPKTLCRYLLKPTSLSIHLRFLKKQDLVPAEFYIKVYPCNNDIYTWENSAKQGSQKRGACPINSWQRSLLYTSTLYSFIHEATWLTAQEYNMGWSNGEYTGWLEIPWRPVHSESPLDWSSRSLATAASLFLLLSIVRPPPIEVCYPPCNNIVSVPIIPVTQLELYYSDILPL